MVKGRTKFFYPSVDCGPINNSKAKQVLGFTPTPLEGAIQETVDFFLNARKFAIEKNKMKRKLEKLGVKLNMS
jgi:hypothetical protein